MMRCFGVILILLMYECRTWAVLKDGFTFEASICKGKNGGLLPLFGTCTGYLICNDGKAVVGSCKANRHFNPHTLRCDAADKVNCIYDNLVGILDDDEELKYDKSLSISVESDEYESEEPITLRPTSRPPVVNKPALQLQQFEMQKVTNKHGQTTMCRGLKTGVTIPKSGSCSEYYMCRHEKPQLYVCAAQQHFSAKRQKCVEPAEASCLYAATMEATKEVEKNHENLTSKPAITGGFCTDEKQDSLVPHRDDCGKFMLCTNMMFLVMDCPKGLHFNVETKRCDYAKTANCQLQATASSKTKKRKQKKGLRKHKANTIL